MRTRYPRNRPLRPRDASALTTRRLPLTRSHPQLVLTSPPTPSATLVSIRSKPIPKQPSRPARRAPPHRCRRSGSPQTRRPTPQTLIVSKGRRPTSFHVAHAHSPAVARLTTANPPPLSTPSHVLTSGTQRRFIIPHSLTSPNSLTDY